MEAAAGERQKRQREAADKKAKEDGEAKVTMKNGKKNTSKVKPSAAMGDISDKLIGTASNEAEDWSHLPPLYRYRLKKAKIEKERDAEEHAELLKQDGQQLAAEAKAAEGGKTMQGGGGTSGVSITVPDTMSCVSNTSMGTSANEPDEWSHLTLSERYREKLEKIAKKYSDEVHAEYGAKKRAAKRVEALPSTASRRFG